MPGPFGTAVLDDFDRANGPLGANWTADITAEGFAMPNIVSNECDMAGFDSAWWNVESFAADCEVFCTIITNPDNEGRIYARLADVGTGTGHGYEFAWGGGASGLSRLNGDGGDRTTIVFPTGYAPAVGDRVALTCVGDTISCYKDTGSGWEFVTSGTDSTYTAGGFLGIWSQNNTVMVIDDFGGGEIGAPSPSDDPPIGILGRGAGW